MVFHDRSSVRLPGGHLVITHPDPAASRVKELLAAEGADDLALRVAVRPGGCSGFSYEMFFDGEVAADDEEATFGDAVKVVRDAQAAQPLHRATLPATHGRHTCATAPRSTTGTASSRAGSPSPTRTRPAPAAAVRASRSAMSTRPA